MAFTKEQLAGYAGASVPDLLGDHCRLLFVGINPGLWTAATQTHFCHPSNRFYPAMRRAGLIDWFVDTDHGMTGEQKSALIRVGIGITNLVNRATVRASELGRGELAQGARRLRRLAVELQPAVVAVAGVTAFRQAFGRPGAALGPQEDGLAGSELWVVPNPSGLNAHETVDSLAGWYRRAADAAGLR